MKTKFSGLLTLLLAFFVQISFAQEKTISGTVSDESGPLPGVSVLIKGTTTGTETDFDGNYSIRAKAGDVLVFSFVGMATQEKTVGASNTINIVLVGDNILEEVVVMGYATQRKTEVTGSTVQVNADQIEQIPVASVDQVLQGKVPGLVINNSSGTPGAVTDIRIRGISSITAGNEPLYVIDGVPIVNNNVSATTSGTSFSPLASLNASNIESITVLKDASATAAYGARGANGVIVITTKTGKSGQTRFDFSSSYGFANDAVPGPDVLTGAEREMLFYESLYNSYGATYNFTKEEARDFYQANPNSFGTDYTVWNNAGRPEGNWAKVITNKNAPVMEYNISATGGDESYNFYTSLGYFKQEATVIGSKFDRITGSLNFEKKLTDNFKFSSINTVAHSYQDGLLEASAYFSSPRAVKFFMPPIEQPYNADGSINIFGTSLPNPLWIAQEDIDDSKLTRIISNNAITWDLPIKNLSYTSRVSIDYQVYNYKRYRNPVRGDGASTNGYGWQANRNRANYVIQNSLNYSMEFNDVHKLDLTVLQEWQKNRLYYLEADGDSFGDVGLTNLNSSGNPTTANSWFTDWAIASYLGLAHFSAFDGKYVLDASFRREGNSRFSAKNRWGNFWAVGGAWNVYKENFLMDSDLISDLKLRASYGVTGNANIDLNQYQSLLSYDFDYAGEGASYPSTVANPDLSWETSHTIDLGIDFGFLKQRITGSFGYFRRESKDLLLKVDLSQTVGIRTDYNDSNAGRVQQTRNIGRMENKGFEGEINFKIVQSEDFNLSLGGNVATVENKVLELAKDPNGVDITPTTSTQRIEVGHPVNGWYMREWAMVDPTTGEELWYTNGAGSATTNDYNQAKQVWMGGSALPKITAGANLHFDFKGFFIDANAYYAGGQKVYEDWARYTNGTDFYTTLYYQGVTAILDRWQQPGDTGVRFGKFRAAADPWRLHSKFLYDGDFIRLKNVTFGYNFNKEFLKATGIDGARVFVRGTNLFTWVKDDHLKYDPEIDTSGFTSLTTPPVKSIIFGVNIKF